MELLVALTIAGTIFFGLLAIGARDGSVRARLEGLRRGPGDTQPEAAPRLTASQRLLAPAIAAPAEQLRRLLPSRMVSGMQQRLIIAGEPMTLTAFLTLRLVCIVSGLGLPILLFMMGAMKPSLTGLAVFGGFALGGFYLPLFWLRQRIGQRQHQIIKSLPDAFDLITTCVEAGLGLEAALSRVAEKVQGPFAEELSRTLREIGLGRMRRDALKELGERTGVPDLVTFVSAVIQAEQMGSSVGQVLRVQAAQLRVRRRQRAEAQAYRAPVKMIFPLVLCIFPTLFIVILGPAVITITRDFPG